MKKICWALIFIFVSTFCLSDWGSGLEVEDYKNIDVVIERLSEDAKKEGLSRDIIRAKVELHLRRYGFNPKEGLDPYLYVRITISGTAFSCEVAFKRALKYTTGGHKYKIVGSVWVKGITGVFDEDTYIYQALSDLLDIFINDYLKANEK
jgi:hypothetical protein